MHKALRLASIFSDHMVLCRDRDIRIFGEAQSGGDITVHIHDHTASCTAVKGKFEAVLPPMPSGGPHTLTVSDGKSTLSYNDVFIGDVYLAGGQSNMEMKLENTEDGKYYVRHADFPLIRYCNFPVQAVLNEETLRKERDTKWKTMTPGACGDISGVAFHFAVKLQSEIHVPIGIIGCNLGGTPIASWLDEEAISMTTGGQALLDAYRERNRDKTEAQYEQELQDFTIRNQAWSSRAEAMRAKDPSVIWDDFIRELGPCPWPPPEGNQSAYRPCGLAETMLKRIAPYTITAFLYYQGESDDKHPHLYRALMMTLIAFWRDLFVGPFLPFLFVQLPMYRLPEELVENSWALVRQAQEAVFRDMRNTGLAVIIDGGEENDIHPKDKKTVGERLYLQAMRVVYHQDIDGDSPRAVSVRPEGNTLVVQVSAPLRNEKCPRLFEAAGDDGVFYPADAVISDSEIRITSSCVTQPRFVRYAWVNYGKVNVFGVNGLPLAPFSLR